MSNIKGIKIEIGAETTQFDKALKSMKAETNVVQKELNAVNKALKLDPKNVDLIKQKEELLGRQIENTKVKIDKLKAAKDKADRDMANGTEINQEEYRILVREISAAENQLESLIRQNDKFGNSAKKIGNSAEDIGKKGMAVSGAIIGIGTAAVTMGIKAAQSADDINTLSKQTGLSTEQIQKFQYASERIDVPLETLTGSMAKLTRNMQSAKNGSKNTQLAFDELGISITDNEGKLRNNQDVFNEAIDVLAKMENETQRDAVAMQIFGKSAQDLNPLILGGSEALKQYSEEAEKAGLILSQDTLDAANELGDAVDKLKATATGAFAKVGSEIATKLTPMIEPAADKLVKVVDVVSDLDDAQLKLIGGIGIGIATIPPLLIGTGKMITAIGAISTAYKEMAASATVASIASKAIPFVAVAGAAIGLIGVISQVASATDEETKKTRELHEANMQRHEDYQKIKQAAQEQAETNLAEINYVEKLKNELMQLADESGRVADSDKARAEFILGQLNSALGTEYTMTGNLISKYGELSANIDALIIKKKAEIILSSKEEAYKTAIQNIEGEAAAYSKAKSEYLEAKKAFEDYEKGIHDGTINITRDTALQLDSFRKTAEEKENILTEAAQAYDESLNDIGDYETTVEAILKDGEAAFVSSWEDRTTVLTAEQKKAATAYEDSIVELADYATKYSEGVEGYTAEGLKELQSHTEELKTEAERIGVSINDGMCVGLQNTERVQAAITNLCSLIPEWARKLLGINSPAKIAIPIGEAIPEGLGVGIENDMSAEEALEKKCRNLQDILQNYLDVMNLNIELAEIDFDLWKSENKNTTEYETLLRQQETLNIQLKEQESIVNTINDALAYQRELTGEESEEYNEMLKDLKKAQLEQQNLQVEQKQIQTDIDKSFYLKSSPSYSQSTVDLAKSKYELFLVQNPEATEVEKLAEEEEMLNVQYNEQAKKVQRLNDELWYQNQLTGEASEESIALRTALNEETKAYLELANAIQEVNKEKASYSGIGGGSTSAASIYTAYHVQYGAMLKSQGVSQEDIDKAAREVSGYTGKNSVNIINNNYGVTTDTAYKVSQETKKTANNLAMQGVL